MQVSLAPRLRCLLRPQRKITIVIIIVTTTAIATTVAVAGIVATTDIEEFFATREVGDDRWYWYATSIYRMCEDRLGWFCGYVCTIPGV